ncbi:MAG: RHS repeat-associated core domain-containing protein [Eubacteriales bacterium]|nr:RHS repeat-associated core domain-containing protein [Eubacteriales bacterium]
MTDRKHNGIYGNNITYDAIGNLTTYAGWTYTWKCGRQLVSQVQGNTTITYAYDVSGMRVRKTVNGVTHDYTWNGGRLVHLKAGTNHDLHFFYDAKGTPAVVLYNGSPYAYVKNLQGDIVAIVDASGNTVVQYRYDPWGRKMSRTGTLQATLGYYNPFRYRGYIFDEETWMYYLKNRYYYPELRRFISVDPELGELGALGSHNRYCYCFNDPITYLDDQGLRAQNRVHQWVVEDICNRSNGSLVYSGTKISYNGGSWGFADIIERSTNSVWEVKRVTHSGPKALEQIRRYLGKGSGKYLDGSWNGQTLIRGTNRPELNGVIIWKKKEFWVGINSLAMASSSTIIMNPPSPLRYIRKKPQKILQRQRRDFSVIPRYPPPLGLRFSDWAARQSVFPRWGLV